MINVCRGVVKIVQCVRVAYQGLCEILIIRVSWLRVCCLRFDVLWRYFTLYLQICQRTFSAFVLRCRWPVWEEK